MKLLYVVSGQSYSSSNPGRKIQSLVRCWREMGHEIELICGGDVLPPRRKESVRKGHANLANPPWYRKKRYLAPIVNSVSEVMNLIHDRRLSKVVTNRIRTFKPDLYLQRSSRFDGLTLSMAINFGVPTVLEWKDGDVCSPRARRVLRRPDFYGFSLLKWYARKIETWKESAIDFFIVESGVLKQRLSRELGRDSDHFVVAHNAVEVKDFEIKGAINQSEARKKLGLHPSDFISTFIGSFAWYQGVELLIDAIATDERLGPPMRVVLVGDGPGRKDVERRTRELGVEDRVDFVGKVPHEVVPQYLAAANAAVLPDCTDIISPIKVLEYMSMGLPVVLPDYEANREVVEHDVTGFLFEPRDAVALGEQLRRIQQNPELGSQIGEAARTRARERFSWERTWGRAILEIRERTK